MRILRPVMKYLLVIFYVGAGINHFVHPGFYLNIMPPYLPWHVELVYLSGIIEIALGIMVLIPRFTSISGWSIIALLIAVFPANIHMALNPHLYPDIKPVLLYIRLPLQGLFMYWAYWVTRPAKPAPVPSKVYS
jgi:uncharacterized membrane protein